MTAAVHVWNQVGPTADEFKVFLTQCRGIIAEMERWRTVVTSRAYSRTEISFRAELRATPDYVCDSTIMTKKRTTTRTAATAKTGKSLAAAGRPYPDRLLNLLTDDR